MKYINEDCNCSTEPRGGIPRPAPSMTDTLKETGSIANEVLSMARTINAHLFGKSDLEREEKEAEPKCFRDEMDRTKSVLRITADELRNTLAQFGL